MKVSTINKKYFTKDDGTPLFLVGSYDMALILLGVKLWRPLLNSMANKANYLRIVTMGQDGETPFNTYPRVPGSGKTSNGIEGKFNLDTFNFKFFRQLKLFLTKAKECGVYVHLSLFNEIFVKNKVGCGFKRNYFGNGNNINVSEIGNVDRNNDGDGTDGDEFYDVAALKGQAVIPQRLAVARLQKKYVDKVINIAKMFDNVFFEVGNEVLAPDWVQYWVTYISARSSLPITIPSESFRGTSVNLDGICHHRVRYDYQNGLDILVGLDSDGDAASYDQANPDFNRDAAWKTFLSGHSILGNYAENIIRKQTSTGIVYSYDSRLTEQFKYFGYLQKFINESGFNMLRARYNKSVTNSEYCMANIGKQYLVYLENKSSCTVNLTRFAYRFKVSWYNSKNGTFITAPLIKGGKTQTFTAPVGCDVLFLAKKF